MSTNRSVGRFASTHENDRSAITDKPAAAHKKDRSGLCAFTFADGRQCRAPRHSRNPHYCYFHAQKEAESLAAKEYGEAISTFFYGNYLTACDFASALGRVFSAVANGHIKPRTATSLAYLGQTLNQSIKIAQDEYANVFGGAAWRKKVASCVEPPAPASQPPSQQASAPQTAQPAPATRATSSPDPQPANAETTPASQPIPAPPTPSKFHQSGKHDLGVRRLAAAFLPGSTDRCART
jgi:hypothetical protein